MCVNGHAIPRENIERGKTINIADDELSPSCSSKIIANYLLKVRAHGTTDINYVECSFFCIIYSPFDWTFDLQLYSFIEVCIARAITMMSAPRQELDIFQFSHKWFVFLEQRNTLDFEADVWRFSSDSIVSQLIFSPYTFIIVSQNRMELRWKYYEYQFSDCAYICNLYSLCRRSSFDDSFTRMRNIRARQTVLYWYGQ